MLKKIKISFSLFHSVVVSTYISAFFVFLHMKIQISHLFLLNAIYKQVGVYSEMCSDIDTDGRIFQ